jgi:hypothetical protein
LAQLLEKLFFNDHPKKPKAVSKTTLHNHFVNDTVRIKIESMNLNANAPNEQKAMYDNEVVTWFLIHFKKRLSVLNLEIL